MNHLGTKALETDRLLLRPFNAGDAHAMYHNWANDPEVTQYLTWPTHENVEVTKNVLASWIASYEKTDTYQWAIVLKENGTEPIGSMAVVKKEDHIELAQIGYCIGRKWWNQGITSEALSAVIKFLFREVGVNRIEARHDPRNPNSGKVMEKCGLKFEGILRQADWNNQGRCDYAMYAILADDDNADL